MAANSNEAAAATASASANAALMIDRFESASSTQDALDSLQSLIDGFKDKNNDSIFDSNWILRDSPEMVEALIHVIATQTHKDLPCEDGVALVCQLYQHGLADNPLCLQVPQPGRLLEVLLDAMGDSNRPVYTRVLALQVLKQVSERHATVSQGQWLQAPNGLHRLADVLTPAQSGTATDNPMADEMVRNEALLVANVLAQQHASIAKVWLFAEVETKLLDLCWSEGGGLTKGMPIVLDCLGLIQQLLKHADASLQDLVWQRPTVAPRLAQLLDLRGGTQFLHPDELRRATEVLQAAQKSSKIDTTTQQPPLSQKAAVSVADDLDDLLQSGDTTTTTSSSATKTKNNESSALIRPTLEDEPLVPIPRLTATEEEVVQRVLNILKLLLQSDQLRASIWKRHAGLCSLVWELALVSPIVPPVCAMPSPSVQQLALEVVACFFNDPLTMDRLGGGMDRVLYLVCTGGGMGNASFGRTLQEQLGISQAALHVLRNTLDAERIQQLLLHSLAPPLDEDIDEFGQPVGPLAPAVISKLWNTVAEYLKLPPRGDDESEEAFIARRNQRKIFLSGALGGLGIFLYDETCREMMFKVTPPHLANLDLLLETLHNDRDDDETNDADIHWILVRFLCEWVVDTPLMVQTLLSSNESTHLAGIASTKSSSSTLSPGSITTSLVHLLLGLAMEHMGQGDESEAKCGGWTRSGILQIITKIGIGKFTGSLAQLTKMSHTQAQKLHVPWAASSLEFNYWHDRYEKAVWTVRRRVVEELTGGGGGGDDDDEDDDLHGNADAKGQSDAANPPHSLSVSMVTKGKSSSGALAAMSSPTSGSGSGFKPLQRLVAQQTKEMEELREELANAVSKVESQQKQLDNWKRRVESTPTELDAMLTEFTEKTEVLEGQVTALQKELMDAKAQHEVELKSKDDMIEQSRQESRDLQGQADEAREDRDRMDQELEALSHAYSSLEGEYQRQQQQYQGHDEHRHQQAGSQSTTDGISETALAGGAETGETSEQRQAQGEVSRQAPTPTTPTTAAGGGSTELATLRAENTRLRNDARAADDWMAMAVERMNEMGAHNRNLQQQVASLMDQVDGATAGTAPQQHQQAGAGTADAPGHWEEQQQHFHSRLQHEQQQREQLRQQLDILIEQEQQLRVSFESQRMQLQQEQELRGEAEARQAMSSSAGQGATKELEKEREVKRHLELQLASAQEDTRIAMDELGMAKDAREQLERNLQTLSEELERTRLVPAPTEGHTTERLTQLQEHYNGVLAAKTEEIQVLSNELEESRKATFLHESFEGAVSSESDHATTVRSLQEELAVTRKEAEDVKVRYEEMIFTKESRIRDLEHRLNSGLGGYKVDDIRERDEEIEELRASNDAAQDWMSKAVEHHQLLSTQVATLTNEKATLSVRLKEMEGNLVPSNENEATIKLLEQALNEKDDQIQQMTSEHLRAEAELQRLRQEMEVNLQSQHELEMARSVVSRLHTELGEVEGLRIENESLKSSSSDLEKRLEDFQDWASAAQERIASILSAKEETDKQLEQANLTILSSSQENSELKSKVELLSSRDSSGEVDRESTGERMQVDLKELTAANTTLTMERDQKGTELSELKKSYDELQAWVDVAQSRMSELFRANESAENLLKQAYETAGNQQQEVLRLQTELDELAKHKPASQEMFEAEAHAKSIKDMDDALEQAKAQLRAKSQALQEAQASLAEDEEVLKQWEGKTNLQNGSEDGDSYRCAHHDLLMLIDRVSDLESTAETLELRLEQQEQESNSAIQQWQANCIASEERCTLLEQELETIKMEKDALQSTANSKEKVSGTSLLVGESQTASDFFSGGVQQPQQAAELEAKLRQTEQGLLEAQATLARDEDVLHRWEGMLSSSVCHPSCGFTTYTIVVFWLFSRSSFRARNSAARYGLALGTTGRRGQRRH
jgi:hypothetical protein